MSYLLIWDIDGTLIQSRRVGRRAMDRAFFELYGIENGFEAINMAGGLDSIILRDALKLHGLAGMDPVTFFDRYCEYLKDEINKMNCSFTAPGISELLPVLHSSGSFYNVLGTGNIEKGARIKLDNGGLNKYFSTGGFGDEPLERWQVIKKAVINGCSHFQKDFAKEQIYVIGDTPKDIECGKIIGVKTIGTAKGPYTAAELKNCGADYAFDDLSNVKSFMDIF